MMIDENPYASPQAESLALTPEDALVDSGESLHASFPVDKRLLKQAAYRFLDTSLAEGVGAAAFFACLGISVIFATTFSSLESLVIGYVSGAVVGLTLSAIFRVKRVRQFLATMLKQIGIREVDAFHLEITDTTLVLETNEARHEWPLINTSILPNQSSFATIVAADTVVIPIPRRADLGGIPLTVFVQVIARRRELLMPKPDGAWYKLGRFFATLWRAKPVDRRG